MLAHLFVNSATAASLSLKSCSSCLASVLRPAPAGPASTNTCKPVGTQQCSRGKNALPLTTCMLCTHKLYRSRHYCSYCAACTHLPSPSEDCQIGQLMCTCRLVFTHLYLLTKDLLLTPTPVLSQRNAHLLSSRRWRQCQELWAHRQARQQPHWLSTFHGQQQLAGNAAAVKPHGALDHWQPCWVVCKQQAAAVAGKLLQVTPHQFAI